MKQGVEVAENLTPAQQHADELLDLVRDISELKPAHNKHTCLRDRATTLLSRIAPPQPPTLEEALYALDLMTNKLRVEGLSGQRETAKDVLERARRTGVFK